MSGLLIAGASGHGKVVAEAALAGRRWDQVAFVDDKWPDLQSWHGMPVVGPCDIAENFLAEYPEAVVAIGDTAIRLRVMEKLELHGYRLASVIHPAAVVSPSAEIGKGTVLLAGSVINAGARLEAGCIVNTRASVDHDCWLGRGVHICPGASIAGDVKIGDRTWIGIGVAVIQGISIGSDVIVGAGAAVINDVTDGVTVVGVPAREL